MRWAAEYSGTDRSSATRSPLSGKSNSNRAIQMTTAACTTPTRHKERACPPAHRWRRLAHQSLPTTALALADQGQGAEHQHRDHNDNAYQPGDDGPRSLPAWVAQQVEFDLWDGSDRVGFCDIPQI